MSFADRLRRMADRLDGNRPPAPPVAGPHPDNQNQEAFTVPPGLRPVLTEDQQASIDGVQVLNYHRKTLHMKDPQNGKYRLYKKNAQILGGCGCVSSSPNDVAFLSQITGLPVCKECERTVARLRAITRNEVNICNHKVAPHELQRVEGYGYLCAYCMATYRKALRRKRLMGVASFFLSPLIKKDPA